MYSNSTYPKNHEKIIALKKEGTLIPNELNNCKNLSKNLSLFNADKIPKNKPTQIAIKIDVIDK